MLKENWKKFLREGEQSKFTKVHEEIYNKFKHLNNFDYICNVTLFVNKLLQYKPEKKRELFRKRSSEEIIRDKFATGCSDYSLALIPLIRKKFPVAIVDLIEKVENGVRGHVVIEALVNGKEIIIDATSASIWLKKEVYYRRYKYRFYCIDFIEGNLDSISKIIERIKGVE